MRPTPSTERLYKVARRRIGHFRALIPKEPTPVTPELDRSIAFVSIELLNLWVQFSRTYYLASCRGAVGPGDTRVTTSMQYVNDAESIRLATNFIRNTSFASDYRIRPREEPNWLQPDNLLRALDHVGASNHAIVGAAIGGARSALDHLPTVRNFYGHRAQNTAEKVIGARGVIHRYGVPPVDHPTHFCLAYPSSSPLPILGGWLETINVAVQQCCI